MKTENIPLRYPNDPKVSYVRSPQGLKSAIDDVLETMRKKTEIKIL